MSSRPYGYAAALLVAAMASAGGCAAVAQRRSVAAAPPPLPSATSPTLVLSGPNEGSFLLRAPLAPPARCSRDGGAPVDIWCEPLPAGAVARLGKVREKGDDQSPADADAAAARPDPGCHEQSIQSLAMSADGELVVTSGRDGARLWQSRTGRPVLQLLLPAGCEQSSLVVAFGPGDRQLVGAGGCALRRYDIVERRSLAPIVFRPIASPDGGSSVAPGDSDSAQLDAGTETPSDPAEANEEDSPAAPSCDSAMAMTFSPAGDMAYVTTSRGVIRRFSLSGNHELSPLHLAEPGPYGVLMYLSRPVVSSDGAWIAVSHHSELFVLSTSSGEPRLRVLAGWEGVVDLDFSPTGTHLAVLTKERLAIVDVDQGKSVHSSPLKRYIHVSGAVRYSADGQRLYVLANERLTAFDGTRAARLGVIARSVDDGAYGLFALAASGLWIHPDGYERMLVRELPKEAP